MRPDPEYIIVIRQKISPEDEALLRERLRIVASGRGVTLEDMARTIPHSASFLFSYRADLHFCCDICSIQAWLDDGALTLDDLHLVDQILDKWSASQVRSNPFWELPPPNGEELELNRKILDAVERLIVKGQFTQ